MTEKYILTLKATAKPHLYIDQIKEMIKTDKKLSQMMKNALLVMRKYKMPYVILSTRKEIILVPQKDMHIERALAPTLGVFVKVPWSDETVAAYKKDKQVAKNKMLEVYTALGYEIASPIEMEDTELNSILRLVK